MNEHTITEKEFDERFTLVKNAVPGGACEGEERFETFGPDLDFILKQPVNHVWTVVEGDAGWAYATGYHLVNRVYYLVTQEPWPEGLLEVTLDDDEATLVDEVLTQMKKDFEKGDVTAIVNMLEHCPEDALEAYLPERGA